MKKKLFLLLLSSFIIGCSNSEWITVSSRDNLKMENVNTSKRDLEDIIIFNEDGVEIRRDGSNLVLNMAENVLFDFNEYQIRNRVKPSLNSLSRALIENPDIRMKIDGFTDNIGGEQYNLELSLKRSMAIKEYLIGKGVTPNHITVEGYGMENPKVSNLTESGRAKNRRVEFIMSRAY